MKRRKILSIGLVGLMVCNSLVFSNPVNAATSADGDSVSAISLPARVSDGLSAIPLSIDDTSLTLVWSKPDGYQNIQDYNIYEDGKKIGDSNHNDNSPAFKHVKTFYSDPENSDAVKITEHNFMVKGLTPSTSYEFTVKGVDTTGKEIDQGSKYTINVMTAAAPATIKITDAPYSAVGDGKTDCTQAIQNAIAACPTGGKVVIPEGTFISGALKITRGNFTLEIDGTLKASDDLKVYTQTDMTTWNAKFPQFINVTGSKTAILQNVRIIGTGTINGSGWKYTDKASSANIKYDDDGSLTESLPSTTDTIVQNGDLAAAEYNWAISKGMDSSTAYSYRSILVGGSYINGIYLGNGLTFTNGGGTTIGMSYINDYTVNGVIAQSFNINNGDCINVSKWSDFTVLNSVVNSGDDDIVMNGGSDLAGTNTTGNAWIFDNYIARGHGGVAFGSGVGPLIKDVLAEDNVMVGTSDGLRCKAKPFAGGEVKNVTFRDAAMKGLTNIYNGEIDPLTVGYQMDGCPFIFTTDYPIGPSGVAATVTTGTNTPISSKLMATINSQKSITYSVYTQPTNGTVKVNADGTFTYTPNKDFIGTDTFTWTATTGILASAQTTETVNVVSTDTSTLPVAYPAASYVIYDASNPPTVTGQLQSSVSDSGKKLTYSITKAPKYGTLTLTDASKGTYTYKPNQAGKTDYFNFTVTVTNDDNSTSVSYAATPNIVLLDKWPLFHDFSIYNVSVDGATTSGIINDGDADNQNYNLNFKDIKFKNVKPASLINLKNSSFTNVTFDISNAWNLDNSTNLTFVNTNPTNASTTEGTALSGKVSMDGSNLTYSSDAQPKSGTLALHADGTYVYTPNAGFTGSDSFTYKAVDSKTQNTYNGTVAVTVSVKSGSSGSSGSSGPSNSSSPSQPAPEKIITAQVSSNGAESATISKDDMALLKSGSVIEVKGSTFTAEIPYDSIIGLFDNNTSLTISEGAASNDETTAFKKLEPQSRNIAGSYSFDLKKADGSFVEFPSNASIKVTLKLTDQQVAAIKSGSDPEVYFYDPSGKLVDMNAVFNLETKTVSFTTNHFSTYFIDYQVKKASPVTGDNTTVIPIFLLSVGSAAAIFILMRKRKLAK